MRSNNCEVADAVKNIPHGGKFLYSAISKFSPQQTIDWFESRGLQLKTERGDRVFPASDKAVDVSALLRAEMKRAGVKVVQGRARSIEISDGTVCSVVDENGEFACKAAILATGGRSYPATGSTGDGYTIAQALGHTVTPTGASIVPLVSGDTFCAELAGLSLKNVKVKAITDNKRVIYEDFGELLFTHFGLSGPTILSASAHLCDIDFGAHSCQIAIDLKPALDEGKLDARMLREFAETPNRSISNLLGSLLPRALATILPGLAGVDGSTPVNSITREQRRQIETVIKRFVVNIGGLRPVEEAVITRGGVSLSEVDSHSMASKLVKGLYFAGELLDVDAYTGGFNLQIAWSTGNLAGKSAAHYLL